MSSEQHPTAYCAIAERYTELFGDVARLAVEDRRLISSWAAECHGRILDAGCGPGHWSAWLAAQGHHTLGVDVSERFITSARQRHPELVLELADLRQLSFPDASFGAALAWYSLIHADSATLDQMLRELNRCLSPGGSLLMGFFDGPEGEPFDHAVTLAYYHRVTDLTVRLERAGFRVVRSETRQDPGVRAHAALIAQKVEFGDPARVNNAL
ncbi:class I SAM-dependent methyltransferase [Glutamicibacter sp. PS]|uniref:class I SAM-dependent methyltransferase n=1 Tax=Glutamicibacter sp. PS TaxID=3075634 RepID=UPI0028479F7C|nr:class I SAM-dependent methyltransferase [Glutamicibacter sp. PS]MDR4534130.1 class I SAM-dependent methyltransferase [Glutamicibacter sp. PS]